MASTIITKNSSTASAVPVVGDLTKGELAVNVTDKKIYTKDNSAAVVKLVGSLGNQEANAVAITGGSIAGITDLAIADGGTGASTATAALNNLLPSQTGNANKYLQTDGTNATWDAVSLSTADITGTLPVANGGTGITSFGTGIATFLGTPSSANLASAVTDETGSGALVFANTPTLVSPILGTPTSGNFSSGSFTWPTFNQNTTGTAAGLSATLAIASGGTGQTTANAAFNALAPSQTSASGKYLKSDGTNTSWDALDISTADITGTLPVANGGTGVTSSTGTGSVVLSNSPTLVTPILGTPQSGNFSTGTFTWPTFNQNTTGTAAGLSATLATTSGGTGLTSFTSGGVVYASSSSALATGSALTFDGSTTLIVKTNDATATVAKFRATNYGNLGTTYISLGTQYDDGTSRIGSLNPTGNQSALVFETNTASSGVWQEGFRLTNTSLYTASGITVGFGLSNPSSYGTRLAVSGAANVYGDERKVVSIIDTTALAAGVGAGISFFGVSESGGGVSQFGSIKGIKENATSANYAGALAFVTSNSANAQTQRMLLDSAGNLGLGVTPSAWSGIKVLQVGSYGGLYNLSTAVGVSNNFYYDGTNARYINTSAASYYSQSGNVHGWYQAPSGTAGNPISFTQAMTLDASGNLGVGTTSPVGRVDVQQSTTDMVGLSILNTNGAVGTTTSSQVRLGITNSAGVSYAVIKAQEASADDYPALTFAVQNAVTTTPTERARIPSTGGFQSVTSISVGNATPSTSGAGITFPATQSASSDANTLDDYEEGTFTATLKGSTSDPTTPVTTTGRYTKIGNLVNVVIQFSNVDTTGAAGEAFAAGLPFTASITSSEVGSVMCHTFNFNSLTSVCCYVGANTDNIFPFMSGNNSAWNGLLHNAGTNRYLWMSVTYRAA